MEEFDRNELLRDLRLSKVPFSHKKEVFNSLSKSEKEYLKDMLKGFNSFLWMTEPSQIKFGVKWYQGDLISLFSIMGGNYNG